MSNYVAVIEATFIVHLVPPFAGGARAEIVSAPKAYGFDTGFVCHQRGWTSLRRDDVSETRKHLLAASQRPSMWFWRTARGKGSSRSFLLFDLRTATFPFDSSSPMMASSSSRERVLRGGGSV